MGVAKIPSAPPFLIELTCDKKGCTTRYVTVTEYAGIARNRARRAGWAIRTPGEWCPEHRPEG